MSSRLTNRQSEKMELKNNDWKHFLTQAGVNSYKYSEKLNAEGVFVDLADSLTQESLKALGLVWVIRLASEPNSTTRTQFASRSAAARPTQTGGSERTCSWPV